MGRSADGHHARLSRQRRRRWASRAREPLASVWQRASMASRPAAEGLVAIPITEGKLRACLADDQQSRADRAGQTSQEGQFAARPRSESIQRALPDNGVGRAFPDPATGIATLSRRCYRLE